jgi:signal transduction histidine kinase
MNKPSERIDFLRFAIDSQLLGELGEKLVTKNYIALSELLKNSYDADATDVVVKFSDSKLGGPEGNDAEIQLIDDGVGMTYDDVKKNWMRIATTNKVDRPTSTKFGRPRTGSKGIGRFACQRMSRRLILRTTARISSQRFETTEVEFDWLSFRPGSDLTQIPNKSRVSHSTSGRPGTTLRLIDLREAWGDRDFTMFQRQVVLLTVQKGARRSGYREDPGFAVRFEAPEFPQGKGVLLDKFMEAGWGTLSGHIDAKGRGHLFLDGKLIGRKEFEPDKTFNLLSGLEWDIAFIPQNKEYFRNPKTLTSGVAELLRSYGGVRVYIDGFRIYPYGDPDDDWLSIDKDVARRKGGVDSPLLQKIATSLKLNTSRALLNYPRHRNLIGRVYLRMHPQSPFVVKMDREGLLDNAAYRQLTEFLRFSLDWMTLWYAAFLRRFAKERRKEIEEEFRSEAKKGTDGGSVVESALNLLVSQATTAEPERVKRTAHLVVKARDVIQARLSESDAELAVLRAVASTGPLMFAFAHEVKGVIGLLDTNAGELEHVAERVPKSVRAEVTDLATSLREASERFVQLTRLFGIFTTAQKLSRRRVPVKVAFGQVVKAFGFILDEFKIEVQVDADDALKTSSMIEAEFYSIVVNLLSNAIKATIAEGAADIKIVGERDASLLIRVLDKGVGLSKDRWEDVFEPLNADPEERIYKQLGTRFGDEELAALGRGTGLGLSLVRGIAETYGGHAGFVSPPKGWNTCVQVQLP